MGLYREFDDQETLDLMYDPLLAEGDAMAEIDSAFAESARVREALAPARASYGPTRDEYVEVYRAEGGDAPVALFFHGGYWNLPFPAENWAFVAQGLVARGITVVVVNYSLAPKVTIDEIVRQSRAAVAWTHGAIAGHGGDPGRIFVTGHSAGGQIVGMLALTDWAGEYGLPADVVKGGVAISGLFDLAPFPYTWLAPKLLLTTETIRRQSPLFHVRPTGVPLIVTYGGRESSEFHRQSAEFAAAWRAAGNPTRLIELADETHLTVVRTYADAASRLTELTAELAAEAALEDEGGLTVLPPRP